MHKSFRKIGVFALCLAILLGVLSAIPGTVNIAEAAGDPNLLAGLDYSFEDTNVGEDPAGWTQYDGSSSVYAVSDEDASVGNQSLKLEILSTTTSPRGIRTPYVNVEGLETLLVSVDFKCSYEFCCNKNT